MSQQAFDEETLAELREGFALASKGKPSVGLKELCSLMHWLGQNPTPQELQDMVNAHGSGGQLTQEQFIRSMTSKLADTKSSEDIVQAFSVFDKDGRGYISASDLRHVLTGMGDRLDEEQVEQMLHAAMGLPLPVHFLSPPPFFEAHTKKRERTRSNNHKCGLTHTHIHRKRYG